MSFDPTKLVTVAENVPKVYNAGYEKGKAEGGSDSQYAEFWDSQQDYGNRTNCQYLYAGHGWNDTTYKPPYDLTPTSASFMFYNSDITGDLDSYGGIVNFSKATSMAQTFENSLFSTIGTFDMSSLINSSGNSNTFKNSKNLETIRLVVFKASIGAINMFTNCTALKNLTAGGKLGGGNANFQWCPLTVESMKSIISVLVDYKGTSNEFKWKIYFSEECWALLDAEGNSAPHGGTWNDYVMSLGWNV